MRGQVLETLSDSNLVQMWETRLVKLLEMGLGALRVCLTEMSKGRQMVVLLDNLLERRRVDYLGMELAAETVALMAG